MTFSPDWNPDVARSQFPALNRTIGQHAVVHLDGPAGSQVPSRVADAVRRYLLETNANCGAPFPNSQATDATLTQAREALADFLGTRDPETVCFGANMTTITFQVSRALARTWKSGDEIIVSRLDHDANFTPWVLAARDSGVNVREIDLRPDDWTLDLQDFRSKLSSRTRLVAVGYASNATGTVNPLRDIIRDAQNHGALTYIDAVHFAPHGRIQVEALGCDFLVCSAYKFFGPHVGVLWGRRELLREIQPYKLRPAPETLPGRWMTGTQNHEGIAGAAAAVEYIASLDHSSSDDGAIGDNSVDNSRSAKLDRVFGRIKYYEQSLSKRLIHGLQQIPGIRVHGITDLERLDDRVPTISMTSASASPRELAIRLAEHGIFAWPGNHYALPFTERAKLEPNGTLRLGALHYNTIEEIDRAVEILANIIAS
ncbi:MAG: cysteine desulfurase-like protein [Planctomycetaceae bacterium]